MRRAAWMLGVTLPSIAKSRHPPSMKFVLIRCLLVIVSIALVECQCPAGSATSSGVCTACAAGKYRGTAMDGFLKDRIPFITSLARDWNPTTGVFDSKCAEQACAGNTGSRFAGTVTTGSVSGNLAGAPVIFVGGTASTQMRWGAGAVPNSFSICSITRYSGSAQKRILTGYALNGAGVSDWDSSKDWLQGHSNSLTGVFYTHNGWNGGTNILTPNTGWVVACWRNTNTAGSITTTVNGNTVSTVPGAAATNSLGINSLPYAGEQSDWQFSRLYIWNSHLSNADFSSVTSILWASVTAVSDTTVGNVCVTCPPNSGSSSGSNSVADCYCNPGFEGTPGLCVACAAGFSKSSSGPGACTACEIMSQHFHIW